MATNRTYDQYCGLARALDIVGERWTPLVVRELAIGPKRFKDLLDGLPGMGRSLLAARLKHLEGQGIVRRTTLPPPAGSLVYELSELGEQLWAALLPLYEWGTHFLQEPQPTDHMRLGWYLIHFRRGFRPERSGGAHESYELRFPDAVHHVRVDDGRVELHRGPAPDPVVVATMDLETFTALGLGRRSPAEAVASGRMQVEGDPEAIARSLLICGVLDEPIAAA